MADFCPIGKMTMRALFLSAAVALAAPAAYATDWIAICYGQDAQYTQTIGGAGYIHVGNGDGTYNTQKLKQTYYDGKIICGSADPNAPRSADNIAEVCANKTKNTISVMYGSDVAKGLKPENATPYCNARVSVH
jgi:opacity protein-like surface antigen